MMTSYPERYLIFAFMENEAMGGMSDAWRSAATMEDVVTAVDEIITYYGPSEAGLQVHVYDQDQRKEIAIERKYRKPVLLYQLTAEGLVRLQWVTA